MASVTGRLKSYFKAMCVSLWQSSFAIAGTFVALFIACCLQSCFTGIESTKKITLSKEDKKVIAPTEEEMLLSDVHATPHTAWPVGKKFYVVGSKSSLLFEPRKISSGVSSLSEGDTLVYGSSRTITEPDGSSVVSLNFSRGVDEFRYVPRISSKVIMSDAIPGLIDPKMIGEVERILKGKTLYTLTSMCTDTEGNKSEGKKFERVIVTDVDAGDIIFPVKVKYLNEDNKECCIFINFGNSGKDSRSFANMFSLSDPREKHHEITPSHWEDIRQGKVVVGMTKEECKLAKGNPSEVNDGHDYSHTLLIWSYNDGTVLYFVDGILRGVNEPPAGRL